ncbi:MAG: CoA transferase [Acidobacteria bacterium]|nr:CoA transferase [Acidobacteriota bacterium]
MSGPLQGIKIIELAGIGPSPYACMLLADLGADVLRCERGNPDAEPDVSWDFLNRSRDSVAVNLKSDRGRELIIRLAADADIVIEGFRPGVAERLGLGPNQLLATNPALVYGRMTGWGQSGPLAERAGHDINYIALSGALWSIGRAGERPVPPLNLVGDFGGGGMLLALGVLAALWHAQKTGEGQVVDAAMVDGAASLMAMTYSFIAAGLAVEERGTNLLDTGAHFYEVYETRDGKYMAVGAIEKKFYEELLKGLGLEGSNLPAQMDRSQWPMLKERFAEIFRSKTRDEWTAIFEDVDACVTPVLSPSEAATHRHNVERNVFATQPLQPQPVPRFSKTPGGISAAPTTPGAGTRRGLLRWGLTESEIEEMHAGGAFL